MLRTISAVLRHSVGRKSKQVLGLCPTVLDLVTTLQAVNRDREARMALLSLTHIAEASTEFFEPHLEWVSLLWGPVARPRLCWQHSSPRHVHARRGPDNRVYDRKLCSPGGT